MPSFLAVLVALALAFTQLASAAQFQSVGFYSDAACTASVDLAATYGLAETSQWTSLPSSAVADDENAPCANVNVGATPAGGIQSGKYTCLSNNTVGGFLVNEYSQPGCAGSPAAIYVLLGPPNATCFNGSIEVFPAVAGPPSTVNVYAAVSCTNFTASAPSASSSTGAVSVSSSSAAAAAPTSSASPSTVSSTAPSRSTSSSSSSSSSTLSSSPSSSSSSSSSIMSPAQPVQSSTGTNPPLPTASPSSSSSSSSSGALLPPGPPASGAAERLSVAAALLAAVVAAVLAL